MKKLRKKGKEKMKKDKEKKKRKKDKKHQGKRRKKEKKKRRKKESTLCQLPKKWNRHWQTNSSMYSYRATKIDISKHRSAMESAKSAHVSAGGRPY